MLEGNDWFKAYELGYFNRMEFLLFESMSFDDLNELQRAKVMTESMKQALVPSGRFMMGALKQRRKKYGDQPRHDVVLSQSMSVCMSVPKVYMSR